MERELNEADKEILDKIKELQLFVAESICYDHLSDMNKAQILINDIQTIHFIWRNELD